MVNFLSDTVSTVREILRRGMSVNLYMFHGGSTFGFMSGAVVDPSYKALVPSYGWFLRLMCIILNKPALSSIHLKKKKKSKLQGSAMSELNNVFHVP